MTRQGRRSPWDLDVRVLAIHPPDVTLDPSDFNLPLFHFSRRTSAFSLSSDAS